MSSDDVPGYTRPLPPMTGQPGNPYDPADHYGPPGPYAQQGPRGPYGQQQGYGPPGPYGQQGPGGPYGQQGPYAQQGPGGPYGPYAPAPRRRRRGRRILKRLAFTLVGLVIVLALGIGSLWVLTPSASQATQIAKDQAREHGIAYPGPQVPANFARALVATEDHRFYSEQGIDPFAVVRLITSKVTGNASNTGGATLEQQLAKMLYTPGRSGVKAETEQVVMAYKLDSAYSKNEILNLYAEVAYYGHGYYGLQAASCGYFGHPASRLTPVQGAMLAGAVNAPSIDDPIDNPRQAYARLTHVVGRMVAVGDITQEQAKQMLNSSLGIVSRSQAGC